MEMTVNDLKTAGKVAQHNHQQQGGTAQLTVNTLPRSGLAIDSICPIVSAGRNSLP